MIDNRYTKAMEIAKERNLNADDFINAVNAVVLARQGKATEADTWENNITNVTDELWDAAHEVAEWMVDNGALGTI